MPQEPCPETQSYGPVAAVYDALMWTVPHALWVSRIETEVRSRGRSPRSALDVACGTGLATEILHRRGYAPVVGVDLSEEMIRIARLKAGARGEPTTFLRQDAAELDLHGATFDLAISLFDSLNYIVDPARLALAFQRIAAHLNPGALFAFDLNSVYALRTEMFTQTDQHGPVRHVWSSRWDDATRLCHVTMDFWVKDEQSAEVRHFREMHVQRGYEIPEIQAMLTDAGFVKTAVYGNYGTRKPNAKSDRWLFVAERSLTR